MTALLFGLLLGLIVGFALGRRRTAPPPVVPPADPFYDPPYLYGRDAAHLLPSVEPTRVITVEDLLNGY